MVLSLEEEAQRFIESKKAQFIAGLAEGTSNMLDYLMDNLHDSDEREYAIKALKEAELWSRYCIERHSIR